MPHYAKKLKDKPYVYGSHFLPHDGAARELGTGKSRQETLAALGIRARILPRLDIDDGIQAVRNILPRCFFDRAKTERLVKCLQNYQRAWDGKNNIFKSSPLHNWASNGADSFRYFAIGSKEDRVDRKNLPRQAVSDYDLFA
jgi:hypothetical protein